MKQPELGKKLAELRKQKGITQEELVARCNVNVRTIQRIETGEVTPRPSTLRLLFEALGFDWNAFSDEHDEQATVSSSPKPGNWFTRFFPLDSSVYTDNRLTSNDLQVAWIAGILYFILGFPESLFEYEFVKWGELDMGNGGYVILKVGVMVSFFFFMRGFIILGHRTKNKLLLFSSYLYVLVLILDYSFDLVSLSAGAMDEIPIGKAFLYGPTAVLFGVGLFRMRETFGKAAEFAGMLEIVIGICFLSIIFFIVGFIFMIPAELLEIYLLFKYGEIVKGLSTETNFNFSNPAPKDTA